MKILIADPDHSQLAKITEVFTPKSFDMEMAANGKESQTKISNGNYTAVILDTKLTNHSFLLVIKFCKLMHSKVIIILKADSEQNLKDLDLSEDDIKNLGVAFTALGPTWIEKAKNFILKNAHDSWQSIQEDPDAIESTEDKEEKILNDKLFTEIGIDSFMTGRPAIFDIFIRISENKYIKIINKGASIDPVRVKNYKTKYNLTHLYFKTEERLTFINYINTVIEKSGKSKGPEQKLGMIGGASRKFIEEVEVQGLNQKIYDEGIRLAVNTYDTIMRIDSLKAALEGMSEEDKSHQFLAAIYSVSIAKNLDWAGKKTIENVIMGCLVHDIGLIRLKFYQRNPEFKIADLSKSELEEYKKHPVLGYELLRNIPHIPEAVKQIVLQHHEFNDGSGFPNRLSFKKIYPLAKIVSLANYFATLVKEESTTPIQALRKFIPDQKETSKFDPPFIKALIKGFL